MLRRARIASLALVLVTGAVLVLDISPAAGTTVSVATESEYLDALSDLSDDSDGPHTIEVTADITLSTAFLPTYDGTQPLTIDGQGHTLDGASTTAILNVGSDAPLTIENATLTNGRSDFGGAISAEGSVTVIGSTLSHNSSTSGLGFTGGGGAISTTGPVTVVDSTLSDNATSNAVESAGGAIVAGGPVIVTRSTLSANTAIGLVARGGAISAVGTVTVTNSTLTGNTANGAGTVRGGAIDATGAVTLTYATVVDNSATAGANLFAGSLTSFGSVVALPQGGGDNCAVAGATTSTGGNYSDDASCGFTGAGDTENGADPQLRALGDFGGPTETRPPQITSPLVDAIAVANCHPTITTDQRGEPRAGDGNGDGVDGCDIGAVELTPVPTTREDCKHGGWVALVDRDGNRFVNQGDCVSFVARDR